jgi:hypothetical protein
MLPADDHWSVAQIGIVALLDGGIEGIAIEMGGGELMEFAMTDQPRRTAGSAAAIIVAHGIEAIPAKARTRLVPSHHVIVPVIAALRSHPK